MHHIAELIRRRFPRQAGLILGVLLLVSGVLLVLGLLFLFLRMGDETRVRMGDEGPAVHIGSWMRLQPGGGSVTDLAGERGFPE